MKIINFDASTTTVRRVNQGMRLRHLKTSGSSGVSRDGLAQRLLAFVYITLSIHDVTTETAIDIQKQSMQAAGLDAVRIWKYLYCSAIYYLVFIHLSVIPITISFITS